MVAGAAGLSGLKRWRSGNDGSSEPGRLSGRLWQRRRRPSRGHPRPGAQPDKAGYYDRIDEVLKRYPRGRDSLAIPTWFWGDEPSNFFGLHVAKYFSDAIREETLLSTATCGVVFSPGSAGTTQEVFQTAAQNHYGAFGHCCPMVFLGKKRYLEDTKIYPLLKELAKERKYQKCLAISDDPDELVEFIRTHPPEKAGLH